MVLWGSSGSCRSMLFLQIASAPAVGHSMQPGWEGGSEGQGSAALAPDGQAGSGHSRAGPELTEPRAEGEGSLKSVAGPLFNCQLNMSHKNPLTQQGGNLGKTQKQRRRSGCLFASGTAVCLCRFISVLRKKNPS